MSLSRLHLTTAAPFILTAGLIASALPAHGTVLYSTSFETPPFTTGPVAGQDGWNTGAGGIATVENSFSKTGSQAVFVDGSATRQFGPFHTNTSNGPLIDLSADIAIFASSTQSGWQFAALGPGLIGFLGGIDILTNNDIEAITAGYPVIGVFPRATLFNGTAWHHVDLLFNVVAQTYSISLDGVVLASGVPFCGPGNTTCTGAPANTYANGLFDTFGSGNDSGYMDNFQVATVSTAPEPAALSLFLAGLFAIGIRVLSLWRAEQGDPKC